MFILVWRRSQLYMLFYIYYCWKFF